MLEILTLCQTNVYKSEIEFFGLSVWIILSHITLPLCIFYRFHSAVALADIWSSAYKHSENLLWFLLDRIRVNCILWNKYLSVQDFPLAYFPGHGDKIKNLNLIWSLWFYLILSIRRQTNKLDNYFISFLSLGMALEDIKKKEKIILQTNKQIK